jgi:hypothetical protein
MPPAVFVADEVEIKGASDALTYRFSIAETGVQRWLI